MRILFTYYHKLSVRLKTIIDRREVPKQCVCLTEVFWYVLQVWLDDSRVQVFIVPQQLQVSGVVLKVRLSDRTDQSVPWIRKRNRKGSRRESEREKPTHLEFL